MSSFSFNGIKKSYIHIARGWSMPAWAPITRSSLRVPGRPGSITTSRETDERAFPLPIIILSKTIEEKQAFSEDIATWLLQKKPCPLVFDKYPNRTLYAEIEGTIDIEELWKTGQGVLNVYCSDPYKYGPSKTLPFENGLSTIHNNGTIDVAPIVEATVLEDITFLDVFNDEGYMRIGQPVEFDNPPFEKYTRVLLDKMETLTGWSSAGTSVDGGTVTGNFTISDGEFAIPWADDYGTGSTWHGPSVKKSIPQAPLTDFKVEIRIKFPTLRTKHSGRIELYLLDDQSQVIGKLSMKRTLGGSSGNTVEIRLGNNLQNKFLVNYASDNGRAWNDFSGLLRLTRTGNVWEAYIAQVNPATSVQSVRHTARFVDSESLYTGNLSQVQVHMAQNGTMDVPYLSIYHLTIDRINQLPTNDTPYVIAKVGDVIKFDHKRSEILINGEDKKSLKDFGARFFKLPRGVNTLLIEPSDKVIGKVTIEEGYL